jgi:hypothetical protein
VVAKIDTYTHTGDSRALPPIPISPALALTQKNSIRLFGVGALDNFTVSEGGKSIYLVDEPESIDEYFESAPFLSGYISSNQTLQYNATESPFALQIGLLLFGSPAEPFTIYLQQFPYISQAFRVDVLLLPMMLIFGFSGVIFSVIDLLLLKADRIVSQFRVTGITEFTAYLGVLLYKVSSTFLPFLILVMILGYVMDSVLFGNGGRWLAAILTMLCYAYSTAPLGALIAKKFITKDFKTAATVFPGMLWLVVLSRSFPLTTSYLSFCKAIYLTIVSLPYIAWNVAFQVVTSAHDVLLVVGDILTILPPVAFQRGIGSILELSPIAEDPNLSWEVVWSFENRVWLPSLVMFIIGSLEWYYLIRLTSLRPSSTKLSGRETCAPSSNPCNFGVEEERKRSLNDLGINARDLVKLFRVTPDKGSDGRIPYIKEAVKGVSFGVKHTEILAIVGPNGAGM